MKKKKEYQKKTLQGRVIVLFALMALILDAVVIGVGYRVYTSDTIDSYRKIGSGIAQVIASSIDSNKVPDMLEGEESESYELLKARMVDLLTKVPDVQDVYIYNMQRDGMYLLLDTDKLDADVNEKFGYTDILAPYIEDFLDGDDIASFISGSAGDRMMTSLIPVYDVRDKCVCYTGCDISLEEAYKDRDRFAATLSIIVFIPTMLVVLLAAFYVQKRVINPINRLDVYLRNYASGANADNLAREQLKTFGDDAANEILSLRDDAIKMMDDISEYSNAADKYRNNITKGIEAVMDVKNNNGEHLEKYSEYARIIMDELRSDEGYGIKISDSDYNDIIRYAPLYDMGELFISDTIMNKSGKLTDEEYEKLKTHTVSGKRVVDEISNIVKRDSDNTILSEMTELHHERWDGKGYPKGLKGEAIPLAARIIAVVDVFNAIISKRSYKTGQSAAKAFDIIESESGKQFDPAVVRAFMARRSDIEALVEKYSEDYQ